LLFLFEKSNALKLLSTTKISKDEFFIEINEIFYELHITGIIQQNFGNCFVYFRNSTRVLFLNFHIKSEIIAKLHYLTLTKLLPIYGTSIKLREIIIESPKKILFWVNNLSDFGIPKDNRVSKILVANFESGQETPSVISYESIILNIPYKTRKIINLNNGMFKNMVLFIEENKILIRKYDKPDIAPEIINEQNFIDLILIKNDILVGINENFVISIMKLEQNKEKLYCNIKKINDYTNLWNKKSEILIKLFYFDSVANKTLDIFGINNLNKIHQIILNPSNFEISNIKEIQQIPINLFYSKIKNQKFINNSLIKNEMISYGKFKHGPYFLLLCKYSDKIADFIKTQIISEKILWIEIIFNTKSADFINYFVITLTKNTSENGIIYTNLYRSTDFSLILKTKLLGITEQNITKFYWDNTLNILKILVDDQEKNESKLIKFSLDLHESEPKFKVSQIDSLPIKTKEFYQFYDIDLNIQITDSNKILIYTENSFTKPILSIELVSYCEKMQIMQKLSKVTEAELNILDEKLGILDKENILEIKPVSLKEYVENKIIKLWVITNCALYLIQCNLNFNEKSKSVPQVSYTILDHIHFALKLGLTLKDFKSFIFDETSIILIFNSAEIIKFAINSNIDPQTLNLRKTIEISNKKHSDVSIFDLIFEKEQYFAKINNELALL